MNILVKLIKASVAKIRIFARIATEFYDGLIEDIFGRFFAIVTSNQKMSELIFYINRWLIIQRFKHEHSIRSITIFSLLCIVGLISGFIQWLFWFVPYWVLSEPEWEKLGTALALIGLWLAYYQFKKLQRIEVLKIVTALGLKKIKLLYIDSKTILLSMIIRNDSYKIVHVNKVTIILSGEYYDDSDIPYINFFSKDETDTITMNPRSSIDINIKIYLNSHDLNDGPIRIPDIVTEGQLILSENNITVFTFDMPLYAIKMLNKSIIEYREQKL